ncbi:hypothetical protein HHI36_004626 [Cryptolaemus montrouzieri]|uniref:Uncharacterized protein n=1 Tax=Cryptolaemus montrouzieri TaxID=559131 RepID=A0ABD2NSE2_9CUCU
MENQFHMFHDNYAGVQFENADIEMLEKGLKHSPYLNSKREENLVNFTAEVELTVKNFLNNDVETKDLIKPLIKKEHHSTKVNTGLTKEGAFNDKVSKSIQNKLKEENLIITKADKGNCIVIVKKEVYNQKILEFLNNNGIKEKR